MLHQYLLSTRIRYAVPVYHFPSLRYTLVIPITHLAPHVTRLSSVLTPSALGRFYLSILLVICRFYTLSETHVGIKIVHTTAINLLTSIDAF